MEERIPGSPDPLLTTRGQERIDPPWHEPERDIVFDHVSYTHEGFFKIEEFRPYIRKWAKNNNYIVDELKHTTTVTEENKAFDFHILFQKKMSHHNFAILNMDTKFTNVVDKHVTIDGRNQKINHGRVKIVINGFVMGFERFSWESKAVYTFIYGIIDCFVYKLLRGRYASAVIENGKDLINNMRGYFELYEKGLTDQIDTEEEKKEVKPELDKPAAEGEDEIRMQKPQFDPREFGGYK